MPVGGSSSKNMSEAWSRDALQALKNSVGTAVPGYQGLKLNAYDPGQTITFTRYGQVVPDELDLRQNAIESLDDVQSLMRRTQQERGRRPEEVIFTSEQWHTLIQDTYFDEVSSMRDFQTGQSTYIFGMKVVLRP